MELRRLDPGEASTGAHTITAVDADGTVVARYECPCQWCEMWRAFLPELDRFIFDSEPPHVPAWLGG